MINTSYNRRTKLWTAEFEHIQSHARTKTDAVNKLHEQLTALVRVSRRGPVVFPVPGEAGRVVVLSGNEYGVSCTFYGPYPPPHEFGAPLAFGGTTTYSTWEEAERSVRLHLAQLAHGAEEDWEPWVRGYSDLTAEMHDHVAWQERYAKAKAEGMSHEEAHRVACLR